MKNILLMLAMAFPMMFVSCCDKAVSQGRETYKEYFKSILKDPDSFKVYKESYTKDGEYTVNWVLDYGAKNSFGAMVRETVTFETVGTSMFINGSYFKLEE